MKIEIVDARTVVILDPPPRTLEALREALSAAFTPEIAARLLRTATCSEIGTLGARKISIPLDHVDRSVAFDVARVVGELAIRRAGDVAQLEVNGGPIRSTVSVAALEEEIAARREAEADAADLHETIRQLRERIDHLESSRFRFALRG